MDDGVWDFLNDTLCFAIFGYDVCAACGEEGRIQSKEARDIDPLEDEDISELVFDVMCLLNSYDTYFSGDIPEENYREDIMLFKKKWLKEERE